MIVAESAIKRLSLINMLTHLETCETLLKRNIININGKPVLELGAVCKKASTTECFSNKLLDLASFNPMMGGDTFPPRIGRRWGQLSGTPKRESFLLRTSSLPPIRMLDVGNRDVDTARGVA